MADKLDCALDLMRRLPPAHIEENLAGLIDLVPDLVEQLLSAVDQPLKVAHDPVSKRDYLLAITIEMEIHTGVLGQISTNHILMMVQFLLLI